MPRARHSPLTDAERFPLLTEKGRARLQALREHPCAPRYNHPCGEQLTAEGLARVRSFETALATAPRGWRHGETPAWVNEFTAKCLAEVPFYRQRGGAAEDFFALRPTTRDDLAREPWAFVPDGQAVDELVVYDTSGASGEPMLVLSHPVTSASYLPALRWALTKVGVTLQGDALVSVALVSAHRRTFTYATVSSYLGEAGFLKISLHPNEWRKPQDRVTFLDECRPEVFTGDPVAFMALAELPLKHRPKALVSSASALLPGLKSELETHFGCPVLDVYSMNETRFIAVKTEIGWEIAPPDLYVEILDEVGRTCAPGEHGEITLTGGRNPFLPLLRYRTGDFAALEFSGETPVLVNFTGRPPIFFLATDGRIVPSLDVNNALRQFPLAQFALRQRADHSLALQIIGRLLETAALADALRQLFGAAQPLEIETLPADFAGKLMPFASEISDINLAANKIRYSENA
jgi:phenylacetate-CoA ligase